MFYLEDSVFWSAAGVRSKMTLSHFTSEKTKNSSYDSSPSNTMHNHETPCITPNHDDRRSGDTIHVQYRISAKLERRSWDTLYSMP